MAFYDGLTSLGAAAIYSYQSTSYAILFSGPLLAGTHIVVARYSGDNAMEPSASDPVDIAVAPMFAFDAFAVVGADGQVAWGTTGTTVTHRTGSGVYAVRFLMILQGCAAVANLGYIGKQEDFQNQTVVTTSPKADLHTILVDVVYPGDTTGGRSPYAPVFQDNSVHLHVDCNHALYSNVRADGSLGTSSPGVASSRLGVGQYLLHFGADISTCAPVATATTNVAGTPETAQVHLALGTDHSTLRVAVNRATLAAIDAGFAVVVTCTESPHAVFPSSNGFFNEAFVPSPSCALTASWYDPHPGAVPSNEGYVSTW